MSKSHPQLDYATAPQARPLPGVVVVVVALFWAIAVALLVAATMLPGAVIVLVLPALALVVVPIGLLLRDAMSLRIAVGILYILSGVGAACGGALGALLFWHALAKAPAAVRMAGTVLGAMAGIGVGAVGPLSLSNKLHTKAVARAFYLDVPLSVPQLPDDGAAINRTDVLLASDASAPENTRS